MKQARKPDPQGSSLAVDAAAIVQIKIWLLGVSPMVWRRVQVSGSTTLRELHGVIQVAMGWEGIHLYQFSLRATRYGSSELSASSPDVTLAALRLRQGARFLYEYDLNIPWRHEVRIEEHLITQPNMAHPVCIGGNGAGPPEDCHDPAAFMSGSVHAVSWEVLEDLGTMAEVLEQVVIEHRADILDDEDTRCRLEQAVDRTQARERANLCKFARAVHEFAVYISSNAGSLINYGERYRAGERISSCLAESTVNVVISKRFAKRQQMQWTPRGAHLLLQTRTRALDGTLRPLFERWHPSLAVYNSVCESDRAAA